MSREGRAKTLAADRWTEEHHLTPAGWVRGPRPADAVETWELRGYQRSGWSPEERSHLCIWHEPSRSAEEREELRSQFKSPFDSLSSGPKFGK